MKLGIVTPLKNERKNLIGFLKSIKSQSITIEYLLILENDSDDGSKVLLSKIKRLNNVKYFEILNLNMKNKEYALGIKYSSIVKKGFDHLIYNRSHIYDGLEYIGILDADCLPQKTYYESLIKVISSNDKIGLVGGILNLDQNNIEKTNFNHIRGSGRVWKKECFIDSDYKIGISADANSLIRAKVAGWRTVLVEEANFYSRAANSRVSKEYAGHSAYYNGFSYTYVILKFFKLLIKDRRLAKCFLKGYYKSYIDNNPKNQDTIVIDYNKNRFKNKLSEMYKRKY